MGVPGFYSWLTKRYPMIKHMISNESLPEIDYLYLDMNGIIYKCVKDDSIIFKAQLKPKQLEEIWIEIFNYIDLIVGLLKPKKMLFMALDGVAPRSKMNHQRSRRFKSARDYKDHMEKLYGYTGGMESSQNFKNNSISPGTQFMQQLNRMLNFFVLKKIEEDDYWKQISVIFTGSDSSGQGEHKIMQFVRANQHQFQADDSHCFYGADADLIMLGLTLPMTNICIIREEYIHAEQSVKIMASRQQKQINFELIYLTILRECFDLQYQYLKEQMQMPYDIHSITRDFVFLFFFIGNDFLPRIYAFNIREKEIEKLITCFKSHLLQAQQYITSGQQFNMFEVTRLLKEVYKEETYFIQQKIDQANKFINSIEEVGNQFDRQFRERVLQEEQSLLVFKQLYSNQDGSVRAGYYRSKFNIDPYEQADKFNELLSFYSYGLKFVFEYYFVNLPSWSWYYPYHYAPLLSDIFIYFNCLLNSNLRLEKLKLDNPFEPFKQLLCILPKESSQLLPHALQNYLTDPTSKLRNPIDFYPDSFESDLYGSTRNHEAISLIPFLDQQLIFSVYTAQINNMTPEQLKRNEMRLSRLYQYNQKVDDINVESPLRIIKSFACSVEIKDVNLLDVFLWRTGNRKTEVSKEDEKLFKMATLRMRPFRALINREIRSVSYNIQVIQDDITDIKLGETVYFGYPQQYTGRVQALLNKKELVSIHGFSPQNYRKYVGNEYQNVEQLKMNRPRVFEVLANNCRRQCKFINFNQAQTFAFIVDMQAFTRCLNGNYERIYKLDFQQSYSVVPLSLVSKERHYRSTQSIIRFSSLEKEFRIGEEVLVCCPRRDLCGSKAEVIGYSEDNKKVKIRLRKQRRLLDNNKVLQLASTDDIFFTMRFVSQIVKIRPEIIQTLLGSVNITLPKDGKMPPQIDIGLNFICRKSNQIVPNLVRINFDNLSVEQKKNPFKFLEFSIRALELLIDYCRTFPEIITFITERHNKIVEKARLERAPMKWNEEISAQQIYPDEKTINPIMKAYLWLVEKEETHMPVSSIYSKQILQKRIVKLQEMFTALGEQDRKRKEELAKSNYEEKKKEEFIDPNFLFSHRMSKLGSLYLSQKPKNHAIGDQVICIAPEFFGHFGVVIGINDTIYQVLFEHPSFGKNSLGGLCDNLWGSRFTFRDLLNLQTWLQCFSERKNPEKGIGNMGWINSQQHFIPKYRTKPIQDFNDFTVLIKNQSTKKLFPQIMLEHIIKVRDSLNQVVVDKDFIIVDNRKEEHRYKYDHQTSYISKEEVEETAKVAKWIQKPINVEQKVVFEEEIIENKLEKEEKVSKEEKKDVSSKETKAPLEKKLKQVRVNYTEIGEQEDATDIIG